MKKKMTHIHSKADRLALIENSDLCPQCMKVRIETLVKIIEQQRDSILSSQRRKEE